jgi:hypothetical protein
VCCSPLHPLLSDAPLADPPSHALLALTDTGTISIVTAGYLTVLLSGPSVRLTTAAYNPVTRVIFGLVSTDSGKQQLYRFIVSTNALQQVVPTLLTTVVRCTYLALDMCRRCCLSSTASRFIVSWCHRAV